MGQQGIHTFKKECMSDRWATAGSDAADRALAQVWRTAAHARIAASTRDDMAPSAPSSDN